MFPLQCRSTMRLGSDWDEREEEEGLRPTVTLWQWIYLLWLCQGKRHCHEITKRGKCFYTASRETWSSLASRKRRPHSYWPWQWCCCVPNPAAGCRVKCEMHSRRKMLPFDLRIMTCFKRAHSCLISVIVFILGSCVVMYPPLSFVEKKKNEVFVDVWIQRWMKSRHLIWHLLLTISDCRAANAEYLNSTSIHFECKTWQNLIRMFPWFQRRLRTGWEGQKCHDTTHTHTHTNKRNITGTPLKGIFSGRGLILSKCLVCRTSCHSTVRHSRTPARPVVSPPPPSSVINAAPHSHTTWQRVWCGAEIQNRKDFTEQIQNLMEGKVNK